MSNIELTDSNNDIEIGNNSLNVEVTDSNNPIVEVSEDGTDIVVTQESEPSIEVSTQSSNVLIEQAGIQSVTVSDRGVQGIAVWGNIGGVLSDQTDLQNALDVKLDEENLFIVELASNPDSTLNYTGDQLTSIDYIDNADFTNNSKVLTYTGSVLDQVVHTFDYNMQTWTVTIILSYTSGKLTGKTQTINKV